MNPIVVEPWGEVFQFRVRFMYLAARPLYATIPTANCTLHCTTCTSHCAQYIPQCITHTTHHTAHHTMCMAHRTLNTAQCIQYTAHCKPSKVYSTALQTLHYTLNSALLSLDIPLCHCVLVPVLPGYNLCLCLSVFARLFLL